MSTSANKADSKIIDSGEISFSIEGRIVRELGERLVKAPEVALIELIKNSYDADAEWCELIENFPENIVVRDNGHGMTVDEFRNAWMRIGTSSKENTPKSRKYKRAITGEKGLGRFAVRYLGRHLLLKTVANDPKRGRTSLEAAFDWPEVDKHEDLGDIQIPYTLRRAEGEPLGTTLTISKLRISGDQVDVRSVRTAAVTSLSPYKSLLEKSHPINSADRDPGFSFRFKESDQDAISFDLAEQLLNHFALRCVINLSRNQLGLKVYEPGKNKPRLSISHKYENSIGSLYADLRFFPFRSGLLQGIEVDGKVARSWIRSNCGVAVFDRGFRVLPYGIDGDDWLLVNQDRGMSVRDPVSNIAKRHLQMSSEEKSSTQLNYMLRLPRNEQLIGVVQVSGARVVQQDENEHGLVATADREGFVHNDAYAQLRDIVRGGVEAIAFVDRQVQIDQIKKEEQQLRAKQRAETRAAIKEIETNPRLTLADKKRLVGRLAKQEELQSQQEQVSALRESALEVMSLLGVVAGFMTHEFGAAIHELEKALKALSSASRKSSEVSTYAKDIEASIHRLKEFVTYSQGYVRGASHIPTKPYPARPRIQQVIRVFGQYAEQRKIDVSVDIDSDLMAPLVPVSLYNGIALNLYSNALKAITARSGNFERRIAFRAWNQKGFHYLTVSDTGLGIPTALRDRIFDPLFTTTESNRDPLGSGMGLGLTLVSRCVEAFRGKVNVVTPPPGFNTCFRVEIPNMEKE
ncbi:MAG: ATP-binding protein [Burkholderiales bacterium]|nr:ATP-binding protein [Burkholderiales bacterium]